MSSKRINRYIIREISTPVALSLLIFTFVLLMGRIPSLTELVVSKGIPAGEILQLFSYLLPNFFRITLPLSLLLGILLAFGRLSADSEFVALNASGLSLYSLTRPVLLLAFVCCLITAGLTLVLEPAGKSAFRNKLAQIAASQASVGIRPGIFNDNFDGLVLYTRGMDERQGIMLGVFISDEREGETPSTVLAEQGRFIPDPDNYGLTLRLTQGSIHRRPADKTQTIYQTIGFSTYDINLDIGRHSAKDEGRRRSRGELSWSELEQASLQSENKLRKYKLQIEKHMRIAIAFTPLVFALVGIPLGLQSNRSGKGAGFALALGISLSYYLVFMAASTVASKGIIPVALALWLPNCCFLLLGSYFIHRTAIGRPLRVVLSLRHVFSWLPKLIRR